MTQVAPRWWHSLPLVLSLAVAACDSSSGPKTGGLTNWLRACQIDAECGELECVCGACTVTCRENDVCDGLTGASCIPANDSGAIALCGGDEPSSAGLCLPRCDDDGACPSGSVCVADVCVPRPEPTHELAIDLEAHHQTLVGFGASLAYADEAIAAFPEASEFYDAAFAESGIDMIRMRNRFVANDPTTLDATAEILAAATARMGRAPTTFMTSPSPPPSLKANGSTTCGGNLDTCTLIQLADGSFDYAGYADYWQTSMRAYDDAGILPDFVSIQNNPNWIPPESDPNEACYFRPTEGRQSVPVDGGAPVDVTYPGYVEALTAVVSAFDELPDAPAIAAPEVSDFDRLADYAAALDLADVDALAIHLYGTDPASVDAEGLEAVGELSLDADRPLFQSEMQSDGFGTALLIHHSLADANAAAYLQNDLVSLGSTLEDRVVALFSFHTDTYTIEAPYHAIRHYALHTDPGWVRVDANVDGDDVLATAWLSPEADALTLVLVNPGLSDEAVRIDLGEDWTDGFSESDVIRTTFEGSERSADHGALPPDPVLRLPGHSIVTVALWQ